MAARSFAAVPMADFLLIHGGSHGAWCWERCMASLRSFGHRAQAIDLPGHGADPTPRNDLSIGSYAGAIEQALEDMDCDGITVVGHSLAGIALPPAVADRLDRVRNLVLVAAIVLKPGERAIDHVPEDRRPSYARLAEASPDNSIMLGYDVARRTFFDDLSEAEAHKYYEQLTPQPFSVYLERATVDAARINCSRHFVVCRRDHALGYEATLAFGRRLEGELIEVDAGHDVMLSQPGKLAEILVTCAGGD